MRVILQVRDYERIFGQLIAAEIDRELGKRNQVVQLILAVHDVAEIREWVVVLRIWINIAAGVTDAREALAIGLPGFARTQEMANHVVGSDRSHESVIVSDDLAGRELEVVSN